MADESSDSDFDDDDNLALAQYNLMDGEVDNLFLDLSDDEDDNWVDANDVLDSDDEDAVTGRRWTYVKGNVARSGELFDNIKPPGLTEEVQDQRPTTILDFFKLFFTLDFITQLVIYTNGYAESRGAKEKTTKKAAPWRDVDIPEMLKFIGMTFLMGIIRKPSLDLYWTKIKEFATPGIPASMPRGRFMLISR